MAQSTRGGPLASIYEHRIGAATNSNEVMGYWVFLAGVVLGILGLFTYFVTAPASMGRGVGYALAATAPALLMSGAVLRFPLRRAATVLVGAGLAVTLTSIAWFLFTFPGGWSLTTGNPAVIMSYVGGLAIIGVAGSVVPLATDPRDQALTAANERARSAEQRADDSERTGRDSAAASREAERAGAKREKEMVAEIERLTGEVDGMKGDDADLRKSKARFEMYKDKESQWRWRLVHDNGNIIADCGEGYSSKANARKGLGSVKLNSLGAEIDEV